MTTRPTRLRATAVVLATVLAAAPAAAQPRELWWPSVRVEARLDSAGQLHVVERQVMEFTGDWNGGERRFNRRVGESFWFRRAVRVDSATGADVEMRQGDLDVVDGFDFRDDRTLRWRARLPGDPPFDRTRRAYRFEYLYAGILRPDRDDPRSLRLEHDFGFADREGFIGRFELALSIDPAWQVPPGFTGTYAGDSLPPGAGFVVTVPLRWARAGVPPGVDYGAPPWVRRALPWLVLLPLLPLGARLVRRERRLGRFDAVPRPETVDEEWLRHHVLAFPPEVVGHAWDGRTGEAEVAATLARLVQEGKLASRVERRGKGLFAKEVLTLELKVRRSTLDGHARALIDGLFIAGEVTDTDRVRAHYKSTGFDPAGLIRKPIATLVDTTPGTGTTLPKPSRWPSLLLLVAGVPTLIGGVIAREQDAPVAFAGLGVLFLTYLFALIAAAVWQRRVRALAVGALWWAVPLAVALGALLWLLLASPLRVGAPVLVALSLLWLAFANSVLNQAMTRESAERIALRKRLAAARERFRRELREPAPALRDEWFAYLIAFGLGRSIDKWFRAFGAESAARATAAGGGSFGRGSSGGQGWTGFGGGGGFSGGGSSASFASAVGAMASSVPSPSSSSSSGGGGGGGGSSGGGGGGGW